LAGYLAQVGTGPSFTPEDGLRLLIRYWRKAAPASRRPGINPVQEQIDAARWLVQHVGGHAKALTLIGAQIESMASADEFISLRAQIEAVGRLPRLEQIAARLSTIKGESRPGIAATLVTSIQNAIHRCAKARDVVGIAAVCAPNTPISIGLLREAVPELTEDEFASAMQALRGASLVTGRESNAQLAVEIHPLVCDVVVAELQVDQCRQSNRMIELLSLRAQGEGDLSHQRQFSPDIAQAQWFAASSRSEPAILLGLLLGSYYGVLGRHSLAKPIEARALEIAAALFGPGGYQTLACKNNLAITLTHLGQYESAEQLMIEAVDGRRALLGAEHRDTLKSETNLAKIQRHRGKNVSAETLGVVESEVKAFEHKDQDTLAGLFAANDLAQEHYRTGNFVEARKLHEQSIEVLSNKYGKNHPYTLSARNNFGTTIYAQGDYHTACAHFEELLEIKERHADVGPEHPSTLTTQANLAMALFDRGDHARAVELSTSAMATAERTLDAANEKRLNITRTHKAIIRRYKAE
jgi:tetratricopeptide (TPR) repeat protein